MTARLSALLEHPQLAGLVHLAGPNDALVSGTRVLKRVPRPRGGRLCDRGEALVVLDDADRSGWAFDAVIRQAADDGAAMLLLAGTAAVEPASAALAERLGLPVLGTDDPWSLATALHGLTGDGRARSAAATVAAAHAGQRAGPGVEDLLTSLSQALHHRVVLLDATGQQAAGPRGAGVALDPTDAVVALTLADHHGPASVELPSGHLLVACPVTGHHQIDAWVAAVVVARVRDEEVALATAMSVVSAAVGQRLALQRMADEREARHRISLLGELLDTTVVPADLPRRALAAGWRLEGWHIGVHVGARSPVDEVAQRADVIGALEAEGIIASVVELRQGWAAWTTAMAEPSPTVVEQTVTAVRRAQRRLAAVLDTQVGVGRAHHGPRGLATTLAEAGDAARLAANRPHTGRFAHVDRLSLAHLMLAWTQTDSFAPAARELLSPLTGTAGHLLETLKTFLDQESSLTATAAHLGVHRNTVAERITRVQRLLAVDLDDPETRLALHLACRSSEQPVTDHRR